MTERNDPAAGLSGAEQPETYFAPAPLASPAALREGLERTGRHPLVTQLLRTVGGLVAVLNEQRQILVVNEGLLACLGVEDPAAVLGLRPGQAFRCVHANDHPGGCGTGRFCTTCGAAIAIVLAQDSGAPQERECLLTVREPDREHAMELRVRSVPLDIEGQRFILLFLADISDEKRREAVSRIFFHDLRNTIAGLMSTAEVLRLRGGAGENARLVQQVADAAQQLADEVKSQEALDRAERGDYEPVFRRVRLSETVQRIRNSFFLHLEEAGDRIRIDAPHADREIETDPTLLQRILLNMMKNAIEGAGGGRVRLWTETTPEATAWRVWNEGVVTEEARLRMFQRYFSTKGGSGRGLGTYSMKLLGEHLLGGEVGFTSSAEAGTTFTFRLPTEREM